MGSSTRAAVRVGASSDIIMRRIRSLLERTLFGLIETILTNFVGPIGNRGRLRYWRARMKHVGDGVTFGVGLHIVNPAWISIGTNSWIDDGVTLLAGPPSAAHTGVFRKPNPSFLYSEGELVIGENVHIAQNVVLQAHGGMSIGDSCGIASGACLYSLSHHYRALQGPSRPGVVFKFSPRAPAAEQALIASPVVMMHSSAVGLNSVVLPGASIGPGAWVAALSLVSRAVAPFTLVGGNPAGEIKRLPNPGEVSDVKSAIPNEV